jgi:flagellar capping protein FliD
MMKKLLFITVMTIIAGTMYGQNLEKGNTLSVHYFTLTLNQGVTMDQYLNFFKTTYKPALEKNFSGMKVYLINGIKGECLNCTGIIIAWKTKEDMGKYYNPDGSSTELTKNINARIKPVTDELNKLVKMTNGKYTSWEIQ